MEIDLTNSSSQFLKLIAEVGTVESKLLVATVILTIVVIFLLMVFVEFVSDLYQAGKTSDVILLKIRFASVAEDSVGIVRIHEDAFDQLSLSKGVPAFLWSAKLKGSLPFLGNTHKKMQKELIDPKYRNNKNFKIDDIEIGPHTLSKLFPNENVGEGSERHFVLRSKRMKGLYEFLNHPNRQTRFANRFAVGLSIFLTGVSLDWSKLSDKLIGLSKLIPI